MDGSQFDDLTRSLAGSRRVLLGGGLVAAAGWLGLAGASAKKRRKKRKKTKKPKPNAFGCLNVGQACNGDSNLCCSGICEGTKPKKGKPDKSRCVGHDARICQDGFDVCTTGIGHVCDSSTQCGCLLTTGNAPFCGDFREYSSDQLCRNCRQDSDCQDEFGPGAACVVLEGICDIYCPDTGNLACIPACNDSMS